MENNKQILYKSTELVCNKYEKSSKINYRRKNSAYLSKTKCSRYNHMCHNRNSNRRLFQGLIQQNSICVMKWNKGRKMPWLD